MHTVLVLWGHLSFLTLLFHEDTYNTLDAMLPKPDEFATFLGSRKYLSLAYLELFVRFASPLREGDNLCCAIPLYLLQTVCVMCVSCSC